MITKPTVFVLGAGASQPYGFPSGEVLVRLVCERLPANNLNGPFATSLRAACPDLDAREFQDFTPRFIDSGCESLDAFVQSKGNSRFLKLVKAAMISTLIPYEHDDALLRVNQDQNWYTYLFDYMRTAEPEDFRNNRVKVITFNFDRSFERRLFLMLRGTYGLGDTEAGKLCVAVPVFHVHGSLGGRHGSAKGGKTLVSTFQMRYPIRCAS